MGNRKDRWGCQAERINRREIQANGEKEGREENEGRTKRNHGQEARQSPVSNEKKIYRRKKATMILYKSKEKLVNLS